MGGGTDVSGSCDGGRRTRANGVKRIGVKLTGVKRIDVKTTGVKTTRAARCPSQPPSRCLRRERGNPPRASPPRPSAHPRPPPVHAPSRAAQTPNRRQRPEPPPPPRASGAPDETDEASAVSASVASMARSASSDTCRSHNLEQSYPARPHRGTPDAPGPPHRLSHGFRLPPEKRSSSASPASRRGPTATCGARTGLAPVPAPVHGLRIGPAVARQPARQPARGQPERSLVQHQLRGHRRAERRERLQEEPLRGVVSLPRPQIQDEEVRVDRAAGAAVVLLEERVAVVEQRLEGRRTVLKRRGRPACQRGASQLPHVRPDQRIRRQQEDPLGLGGQREVQPEKRPVEGGGGDAYGVQLGAQLGQLVGGGGGDRQSDRGREDAHQLTRQRRLEPGRDEDVEAEAGGGRSGRGRCRVHDC
eukprot:scaffold7821_cov99-Isochrysis_galbana.AAC.8